MGLVVRIVGVVIVSGLLVSLVVVLADTFHSAKIYRRKMKCVDRHFEATMELSELIDDINYKIISDAYEPLQLRINKGYTISDEEYQAISELCSSRLYDYDDIDDSIPMDDLRFLDMKLEDIMKLLWKGSPDIWNIQ